MADKNFDSIYAKYTEAFSDSEDVEFIPSGSVILDTLLTDGKGVPLGVYIELYSQAGAGKTTTSLHMARVACAQGHKVVYLDPEHAVNPSQLEGAGLSKYLNNKFILLPIVTFEDAEEIMDQILDDPELVYIFIDSVTSLVPGKLLEKGRSISDAEPGLHARMAALFLQKFKAKVKKSHITVFFINQMRTKIDFRRGGYDAAAGGNAQQFYMDIRIQMRQKKKLEQTVTTAEGKQSIPYGSENEVMTVKNKWARPFIPLTCTVIFGKGVSNNAAYRSWLIATNRLTMKGAGFYTLTLPSGEYKARGVPETDALIKQNMKEIKELINSEGGWHLLSSQGKEE